MNCPPPKPTSTTTSTPACMSRSSLYLSSSRVPMAAPQSSCLRESLEARGYSLFFFRSVRAMMATSSSLSFTMGSLPVNNITRHQSDTGSGSVKKKQKKWIKEPDLSCCAAVCHWPLLEWLLLVQPPNRLAWSWPDKFESESQSLTTAIRYEAVA